MKKRGCVGMQARFFCDVFYPLKPLRSSSSTRLALNLAYSRPYLFDLISNTPSCRIAGVIGPKLKRLSNLIDGVHNKITDRQNPGITLFLYDSWKTFASHAPKSLA